MGSDITTRYHVRRREFLDQNLADGEVVIAVVGDTREMSAEEVRAGNWGSTQLELSDGLDWISIAFEMGNCLERANSLRKINLLSEVINEMREAIELEVESRDARSQIVYLDQTVIA